LWFLPQAAEELYAVMINPDRGSCVSALDGSGLLIDPTVADAKEAIKTAYRRAAKDSATLFIAFIGHGEHVGDNFYLLPWDAEKPLDADTAIHLKDLIQQTHLSAMGEINGLAVLVDACYSGEAGYGAAEAWVRALKGKLRFEVLTAAVAERPAVDGCFTRTLTQMLREGVSALPSEQLHCGQLRSLIEVACPGQTPQHPSYNPDETLWLAKNAARALEPWAQTPLADEIQRLTLAYQPTPALSEVVVRSCLDKCVGIVGEAGSGKSALVAALAWPKVANGLVPADFVHAVALLTEATTPQGLARTLSQQLTRSVPGFRHAQQTFAKDTPYAEQQKLDTLEKQLVEPLKRLASVTPVRLVVDALDRLATGARGSVMHALNELGQLGFMRLLVTARQDTELPKAATSYALPKASEEQVRRYLAQRTVPQERQAEIVNAAQGSWIVARVLADLLCEQPEAAIGASRLALADAYDEMLLRCGAAGDENVRRVLAVLAAAGAGPLLPLQLLCAASEALGGPGTAGGVRDQLVRLRGLAVRSGAGTEEEHAGLFHQTLAEHIAARAPEMILAAHRALIAGITTLTTEGTGPVDPADAVQRYAFEREAEHLWTLGETHKAGISIGARTHPVPRDNLRRWRLWGPRFEAAFGPDHDDVLAMRGNIAVWTGQCGDATEALQFLHALLLDLERVLGPDHENTFAVRSNIAYFTGKGGDSREALRLFQALLHDVERVHGPDHPDTLTIRSNIATQTGECHNAKEALRFQQELLLDRMRELGPDHPDTLTTRGNVAHWTGEDGDARNALRLYEELLPDQERVLGPDHPVTLTTRNNVAHWTGVCGDARKALRLLNALLPDQERLLGPNHSETFVTRSNIAARV
jgi:hypothetical protein